MYKNVLKFLTEVGWSLLYFFFLEKHIKDEVTILVLLQEETAIF